MKTLKNLINKALEILKNKNLWTQGLAEFFGTFLFVFIGLGSIATVISIGKGRQE